MTSPSSIRDPASASFSFADLRPTEVLAASRRIYELVRRTPLVRSVILTELSGGDVYLKLENEQVTGSFKLRGAVNSIASLPPDVRARGVVASSAGNHGLGIAYAARYFNIPATIFVPRTAAQVKRDGIAALGATLDSTQPHYDAAMAAALSFAEERGATFINPCFGNALIAGQGTVALEILSDLPNMASLVVNVGGGGLLGGCASIVRPLLPQARIIGAQSVKTAAMARSIAAGRVVEIEDEPTIAEGLAGQIDEAGLEIGQRSLDEIVTVSEEQIGVTIEWLWRNHGARVEGAGAVATASVLRRVVASLPTPAAIIVSGGNIDAAKFEELVERSV
ncbi:MAG TPA: threonine/serine dehydratase [Gemmatimonadaceae bacterium]|jgi:threonine dehydratase|nr:threonine/serine dehydratase [Gemmatimonadaceae bacterium]